MSRPGSGQIDPAEPDAATLARAAGIDAGATLIKLALPASDRPIRLVSFPAGEPERALEALRESGAGRIGVTGGGAAGLVAAHPEFVAVEEFRAWHAGVAELLPRDDAGEARFLAVSIGTGTSILLVEGDAVTRLGGTPLGGGTLLGLGAALAGSGDFETLCDLARRGDRSRVDLSVADIYAGGDAPLTTDVMASSFARLAKGPHHHDGARPEDLARSIMAMVGENVALLAGSLSLVVGVERIVFGGSTLPGNPALCDALSDYLARFGRTAVYLTDGAFAGALGARRLAAA